jgi:hypothetical protein
MLLWVPGVGETCLTRPHLFVRQATLKLLPYIKFLTYNPIFLFIIFN